MNYSDTINEVGEGFCNCGYGNKTAQSVRILNSDGSIQWGYRKWFQGHFSTHVKKLKQAKTPLYRSQLDRQKECHEVRAKMLSALSGKKFRNRDELIKGFLNEGWQHEALSRILRSGIEDFSYGLNGKGLQMPERAAPRKAPPPYERKPISYERRTELPMLVFKSWFSSLDENIGDGLSSRHEIISSDWRFNFSDKKDEVQDWVFDLISKLDPHLKSISEKIMSGEEVSDFELNQFREKSISIIKTISNKNPHRV
jgi:hypothetical protein